MATTNSDEDWRLCAHLQGDGPAAKPHGIVGRFRDPKVVRDAEHAIGSDVHLTHDETTLFAYARDRAAIDAARATLLGVIEDDGLSAEVTISHWEDDAGEWLQVDPPIDDATRSAQEAAAREGEAPTTQTFVVQVGRDARARFEQAMQEWSDRLDLHCEIVEHPHLLSTQVAFTVDGPAHAVEEFRKGLQAEEWQTIRSAETLSFGL